MSNAKITRRQFHQRLIAGVCLGIPGFACGNEARAAPGKTQATPTSLKAAAIQMTPKLGDLQANLGQAEQLVRQALKQGAEWVILPEMFTSAAAFHPGMLEVIQPVDGAPSKMLHELARQSNAVVGGSFLARRGDDVFNTFILAFPDGSETRHDKDQPTYWENCYYKGGNDEGVMDTPIGPVGSALCWEFIRSQTARRLLDKVNLVVGGSCWWTLPHDADPDSPFRKANKQMLREAPTRFARMLGVPVIHGSHAGHFEAFYSPEIPDVAYDSSYLGEAMIVDAQGQVLASRSLDEGAGVVLATIELPSKPRPIEAIPDQFWLPEQMPQPWKDSWERWFKRGGDYYAAVTLPYLQTGVVNEYEPEFM